MQQAAAVTTPPSSQALRASSRSPAAALEPVLPEHDVPPGQFCCCCSAVHLCGHPCSSACPIHSFLLGSVGSIHEKFIPLQWRCWWTSTAAWRSSRSARGPPSASFTSARATAGACALCAACDPVLPVQECTRNAHLMLPSCSMPCSVFPDPGRRFGKNCRFHHPPEYVVRLNRLGLPLRPREPTCSFYERTGQCKFGPACRFNHPG